MKGLFVCFKFRIERVLFGDFGVLGPDIIRLMDVGRVGVLNPTGHGWLLRNGSSIEYVKTIIYMLAENNSYY